MILSIWRTISVGFTVVLNFETPCKWVDEPSEELSCPFELLCLGYSFHYCHRFIQPTNCKHQSGWILLNSFTINLSEFIVTFFQEDSPNTALLRLQWGQIHPKQGRMMEEVPSWGVWLFHSRPFLQGRIQRHAMLTISGPIILLMWLLPTWNTLRFEKNLSKTRICLYKSFRLAAAEIWGLQVEIAEVVVWITWSVFWGFQQKPTFTKKYTNSWLSRYAWNTIR